MMVMNPTESVRLLAHVRSLDPQAFVILLDASEMRGRGFSAHVQVCCGNPAAGLTRVRVGALR